MTGSKHLPPGSLLLAAPSMLDPNFMHSLVVLCDHDEAGAYGLVVNRPTGIALGKLLTDHPLAEDLHLPVHEGGPVGRDRLQFLHRRQELAEDAIALAPWWDNLAANNNQGDGGEQHPGRKDGSPRYRSGMDYRGSRRWRPDRMDYRCQ